MPQIARQVFKPAELPNGAEFLIYARATRHGLFTPPRKTPGSRPLSNLHCLGTPNRQLARVTRCILKLVENKDAGRAGRRWLTNSENKFGKMDPFIPKKSWHLTKSARPQRRPSGSVHIRQLAYNQRLPLIARLHYARNQHKENINKTISFVKKTFSESPPQNGFVCLADPPRAGPNPHAPAAAMLRPTTGHTK
jgi:hypothetical protein